MTATNSRADAPNPAGPAPGGHWVVEVDEGHRARCEACVDSCPSGVLQDDEGSGRLILAHQTCLCRACGPGEACELTCPELALSREDGGTEMTDARVRLVDGQLVRCPNCQGNFGRVRKLDRLAKRKRNETEILTESCPLCRRKHLVVKLATSELPPTP